MSRNLLLHAASFTTLTFIFCSPFLVHAAGPISGGIVQCDTCTFANVIETTKRLISFAVFNLAVPISIIAIVGAGIRMVMSQGNEGEYKKAVGNLWNILKGFAYVICAALIVMAVLKLLQVKSDFILPALQS